ncbi:tyrosine-type recombinase/integrase [Viridibacillus sp. NPDC093762]|uniref:tyrosine-type recombinase/integrase n=1 Tax=Viridibacillus sp. NPDC093762 TaxID=3390720 RepID=UPI003D05F663
MRKEFDLQLDSFMLHCDAKHLSKKTLKSYDQTLRLFAKYLDVELGITDASKVKSSHIRLYIRYLRARGKYTVASSDKGLKVNYPDRREDYKKDISDTTIANYTRNIKVFFNFLKGEREIKENPMDTIEKIKPKRRQKQLLTPDELKLLFHSFDLTKFHEYRTWLQCRLILDSGIRAGECCGLKPEDIDFRSKSILVRDTKNGKERYVFFGHKMSTDLRRWLQYKDRFSDSPYIFPTVRGTQLEVNNFKLSVRNAGKSVGLEVFPHLLRNNFAKYYLIEGNGDFVTLSRLLGHSSVEVTQKAYLDFTDKEIGKKYQRHSPLNNLNI